MVEDTTNTEQAPATLQDDVQPSETSDGPKVFTVERKLPHLFTTPKSLFIIDILLSIQFCA